MAAHVFEEAYEKCFQGKRVLVTGAGKGLGYAIAKKFYENGAMVFALDKNKKSLGALKEEFKNITTICVDLRDWDETKRLVKAAAPINHLVNNATIASNSLFSEISKDQIDELFNVNFKAVVNVSQTVVQSLVTSNKTQGATIVNISSVFDTTPSKGLSMYSSSKAAILMLTKSMALELGEHGIRVNCISPAVILREMFVSPDPKIMQQVLDRQVIKRPVQPNEVAEIVLFLSSPVSGVITGSSIPADSGMSSR